MLTAAAVAVGQLIQPFAFTFQTQAGDRLTGYITEQLIRAANRWQGLARFEDPSWVDDLERSQRYASQTGLQIMVHGASAVLGLFTVIGVALLLIGLHPLVPLLLLLASVPQTIYQWRYERVTGFHLYVQTPEGRQLDYDRDQLITPEPAKDVRLYGLGPFFGQRYSTLFHQLIDELTRLRQRLVVPVSLTACLGPATAGAVYVVLGWRVASGHGTPGDLVLYGGAAFLLQRRLVELGSVKSLGVSLAFLTSVFRVLHAPSDLVIADPPRPLPRPFVRALSLSTWRSPTRARQNRYCGTSRSSSSPASASRWWGRTGQERPPSSSCYCASTTRAVVASCSMGLTCGSMTRRTCAARWGSSFRTLCAMSSPPGRISGWGRSRPWMTVPVSMQPRPKPVPTRCSGQLPQGLDTRLGREFGGRELSGGEWQKLGLARAFMRDCTLLVLDEPTAVLDVQTEYEVYQRFQDLTRERMSVLISHRFSTVRMADRILLADGLARRRERTRNPRNGDYGLFHLQAAQYLEAATKASSPSVAIVRSANSTSYPPCRRRQSANGWAWLGLDYQARASRRFDLSRADHCPRAGSRARGLAQ